MGIEPMNLILTKDALCRLSYSSVQGTLTYGAENCKANPTFYNMKNFKEFCTKPRPFYNAKIKLIHHAISCRAASYVLARAISKFHLICALISSSPVNFKPKTRSIFDTS